MMIRDLLRRARAAFGNGRDDGDWRVKAMLEVLSAYSYKGAPHDATQDKPYKKAEAAGGDAVFWYLRGCVAEKLRHMEDRGYLDTSGGES